LAFAYASSASSITSALSARQCSANRDGQSFHSGRVRNVNVSTLAPPLEQMLADQTVLACVEVNGLTARVLESEERWDFEFVNHFDRRRDRATRRLHESVKLLHTIRTQAGPALQVNVNQCVAVTPPAPSETDASPVRVPALP
jgi:hypothetical protein